MSQLKKCGKGGNFFRNLFKMNGFSMKNINFAQIFKNSMLRRSLISCLIVILFLTTSCNTLVGEIANSLLETDIEQGLDYMEKSSMKPRQSKKDTKELQKLEKEGKCLICRGIGKTIDGKYTCPKCNGTGLAAKSSEDGSNDQQKQ